MKRVDVGGMVAHRVRPRIRGTRSVAAERARHGFTLVELLVVIGIIAVLLGVLLPAVRGARAQSLALQCTTQLRELFMAQSQYAADNRGQLTPVVQSGDRWERLLARYVRTSGPMPRELMHCPSSPKRDETSSLVERFSTYGINPAMQMKNWRYRRDARMDAARIILMADKPEHAMDDFLTTADGWFMLADDALGQWWRFTDHNPNSGLRHGGRGERVANAVMVDGHVAPLGQREMCRDSGHWYWGSLEGMPTHQVMGGCCP